MGKGSFDYDMFVIDSANKETAYYQLRDCTKDALMQLDERVTELEKLMEVMTSHLDTQSKLNQNFYSEIGLLHDEIKLLRHQCNGGDINKGKEKLCKKK